jgi:DNA-binding transcriptional regulator YdaS (Cro superfamily)
MNFELKFALMRTFGSQVVAARRLGIPESRLSYLVRGHRPPSPTEKAKLEQALGRDFFQSEKGPRAA